MTIAATILSQLGGSRFTAMTGAKSFVAGTDCLTFRIGRNASKANMVKITLAGDDTYTVDFLNYRNFDVKAIGTAACVYADQLRAVFTANTGMATSL